MARTLTRRMLIATTLAATATRALAVQTRYKLFATGSTVTFIFTANGTEQRGTVPITSADIRVDTGNLARSSADVTADIRDVRTGLVLITEAIKSPELLDANTHPTVRFTSTAIRLGARGRISEGAQIEGNLTLRGVTLPIVLDATLSRPAGTPPDDLSILYIRLTGSLSRQDFGASGYPRLADDRVALDIQAEIRALG